LHDQLNQLFMYIMQKQLQRCQKIECSAFSINGPSLQHRERVHPSKQETEIGSHEWKGFASPGHE